MPDVIEMPYRPDVFLAEKPESRIQNPDGPTPAVLFEGEIYHPAGDPSGNPQSFTYRLGGPTCLAGDVIGDYTFHRELKVGDTLVFDDMSHYTMVKTTTFNGVKHPAIALQHEDGSLEVIREFGYEDFRDRLA